MTESANVTDLNSHPNRRRAEDKNLIAWSHYEPLLNQLRQVLSSNSYAEVMQVIGYAGGTHLPEWRRRGVPHVAVHATRWVLHDLGVKTKSANRPGPFSTDELVILLTLLIGGGVSDEQKRSLIRKVAAELNR